MVQATCSGWISASGVSIYLLHHAARDQRVGAGRADHNHDLGGGSIEDLGLVQGDRWGWPVRVVDQGGGSGGPGHGTPQAFNSAVELPRARLGRRQRSIGPGRAVDQGGSARDVGLGGGAVRTCWCRYASSGDLRRHSEADGPFSQTIGCAATDRRTRALTVYSLYVKMPAWGKA